jgi:hypothetical protein
MIAKHGNMGLAYTWHTRLNTQHAYVIQYIILCISVNDPLMQCKVMIKIWVAMKRLYKSFVDKPTHPPLYCDEEEFEGFGL